MCDWEERREYSATGETAPSLLLTYGFPYISRVRYRTWSSAMLSKRQRALPISVYGGPLRKGRETRGLELRRGGLDCAGTP